MNFMACSILKSIRDNLHPVKFYSDEVVGWYTKGCNDIIGFEVYFPISDINSNQMTSVSNQISDYLCGHCEGQLPSQLKVIPLKKAKMLSQDLYEHLQKTPTSLILFDI